MNRFSRQPGFTLAELMATIAVIAVLAVASAFAVSAVARDARPALARNTVTSVLGQARALALRDDRPVLVAFRARPTRGAEQAVEAVTAAWSGASSLDPVAGVVDRFTPLAAVAPRRLPRGMGIAAPLYGGDRDTSWVTTTEFASVRDAGEAAGVIVAVLFAADGTVLTQNPRTDSNRIFVDFTGAGAARPGQRQGGVDHDLVDGPFPDNAGYCDLGRGFDGTHLDHYFCQAQPDDEPYVTMAPLLAVFDVAAARGRFDTSSWTDGQRRIDDLSSYLADHADPIHFNRYTGVAMR
ncbi:MAG: prepilin-type N-terminal cleavage/methylation domain-containing protein [Planctomycetes bacterium]|nr:prepilin-type N-terminal cleavage/methylation domain-containing protein [Planctomycetota bacterium]